MLARHSDDIPVDILTVYCRQKSEYVIFWTTVSITWKCLLIFVKHDAKVNTNLYIDDILGYALLNMKEDFKNKYLILQQDGAPSHTSKKRKLGAETISSEFGARNSGVLQRPI